MPTGVEETLAIVGVAVGGASLTIQLLDGCLKGLQQCLDTLIQRLSSVEYHWLIFAYD